MPKAEALYYEVIAPDRVRCRLCPHHCLIKPAQSGICRVRVNENGKLYTLNYGEIAALALDPLEKKPLYHFYPDRQILSAGTWGCNFSCSYCQNYRLAHEKAATDVVMPEQLVEIALQAKAKGSIGIAFTYNEPSIWFEYVLDTARLMKANDLKTVLVTNGFIEHEPLAELIPFIDAANVDIKAFSEDFYKRNCKGRLKEVKENVEFMAGKIHVELTNLIIPEANDLPRETEAMAEWIASLDPLIPLHLSRYFPAYKMQRPATGISAMLKAQTLCLKHLKFVYLGNLPGVINNTACLQCGEALIIRNGYQIEIAGIESGRCIHCGAPVTYIT
ncbi:MAG TPA: AmmeMemoRadiSam system radical SAM enzyme [Syntrophomonadaceae bacterium]|nr:AmmeMemoRadiSam system radical SAM enzyme [Syntrophomonadaceae bacterium]HNX29535.1 AmmeMemoRadiSam system radical SAM enzyme [Syntrophomonadaceae bacterium]HPR94131.1 AmmeMemoRadiSam system radical SAM enzyme [Syntrophomonadaceae bacterium]